MKTSHKALLLVMLVATLGVWGCTEAKLSPRTSARLRHLESRNTKLEEDYQATVQECVRLRKQLAVAKKQQAALRTQNEEQQQQLQVVTKQRDELQQSISVCTNQRDHLQTQLARFNHDLQALANRVNQVSSHRHGNVAASTVSMKSTK